MLCPTCQGVRVYRRDGVFYTNQFPPNASKAVSLGLDQWRVTFYEYCATCGGDGTVYCCEPPKELWSGEEAE